MLQSYLSRTKDAGSYKLILNEEDITNKTGVTFGGSDRVVLSVPELEELNKCILEQDVSQTGICS